MGRHKTLPDAELLAAARAAFLKHGHAASTREIAVAVGLSQATLFQRFGDKTGLFVAALLPEPIDVDHVLDGGATEPVLGSLAALTDIAARLLAVMQSKLPSIVALAGLPSLDPAILDKVHQRLDVPGLIHALTERLRAWRNAGQLPAYLAPEATVEALLLAIHGAVMIGQTSQVHPGIAASEPVRRFVATLWRSK